MKIIGIVSYKGGVGVSSLCVGIARALSGKGKKVLLCDCRFSGDVDLISSLQDDALFGVDDLLDGRALADCIVSGKEFDFLSAPKSRESERSFSADMLRNEDKYDYIILDSPEDPCECDDVVSVCNCLEASVRCAETLSFELSEKDKTPKIVINRFGEFEKSLTPDEIIDRTSCSLLGIVPFVPFMNADSPFEFTNACGNIASRILGESIPVFEGSKKRNSLKKLINK